MRENLNILRGNNSHLYRKINHDLSEVLLGEEVIIEFIFLGSVQLGEWFGAAQVL
jgi:hypothetical protein